MSTIGPRPEFDVPIKILLLEDSPTDALLMQGELHNAFSPAPQITVATFVSEAISLVRALGFDVAIVDLNLPDSAGPATFERMHAEAPELPLIVFTGVQDEGVASYILRSGAQDYLVKQVGMAPILRRALRFAIERNKVQVALQLREAQLRHSEKQIRRIIEASADTVVVVDSGGLVQFVNPAAERMFGRSAKELIGRAFGFPVLIARFTEIDIVRPDHSVVIAEMRAVEVLWEEQPALLASLRDISERRREHEALEMRVQLASMSAEIGYTLSGAVVSLKHGLQLVTEILVRNPAVAYARIWRVDEVAQELILDASAPPIAGGELGEDRMPVGNFGVGRIAQSGKPWVTDDVANAGLSDWIRRQGLTSYAGYPIEVDGKIVGVLVALGRNPFVEAVVQALASEAGKIGQFIARKGAERELIRAKEAAEAQGRAIRESSDQLNLALRASRTGIWIWDAVADKVTWDDRAYEIFGIVPDGFGGTIAELLAVIHPEDQEAFTTLTGSASCGAGDSDIETEFRIILPDGRERHILSRGRAYHDGAGRVLRTIGIAQDVTEQRHLAEQLRQSQKMEAVGQLAGGIAHDFNNVLNVILGYSSMILRHLKKDAPIYHRVRQIRDAGERGAALTRQLLAYSRKQILKPRVINLADTLRGMDRMVRLLVGEDIEIVTSVDKHLGNVKVDPSQVEQVILNLVVNSRDAMRHGGKLTIELANAIERVDSSSSRQQSVRYVTLAVTDNGCGMSPEIQSRAFEPYFTTKEFGKGTGLGLSTVLGIVQQSGGHLKLYSEVEAGTTIKVFLPQVDEVSEPVAREGPLGLIGGAETILLVEDDAGVRGQIMETLTSVGYKVIGARDGREAVQLSDGYHGRIDLLITDVVMPKMGGPEVASIVKARRPDIQVLYMSGYTGNAIANHGTLSPDVNLLEKPFTPEALCEKLRELWIWR